MDDDPVHTGEKKTCESSIKSILLQFQSTYETNLKGESHRDERLKVFMTVVLRFLVLAFFIFGVCVCVIF
jgi:hypothetical protein